jgi:hypothetical protein
VNRWNLSVLDDLASRQTSLAALSAAVLSRPMLQATGE